MDKDQRLGEGRVEAEDGKLDYEDSSDDEEVKLLLPRKGADERDPPGADIRDVPEASGTQREDWFRSLCMGLGRNGTGRGDPQWYPRSLGFWKQKPQEV